MNYKQLLKKMKLKPCIIRYILIFSLSFIAFSSSAETYYGVLRGSKTILFKSPYQGVVNLSELREGEIKNNIALFEVKKSWVWASTTLIKYEAGNREEKEFPAITGL